MKSKVGPLVPFVRICVSIVLVSTALVYVGSYFWPVYSWGLRLASPDGRYDLVALLGDKAAFDDFFYRIYVFPHARTPPDRKFNTRIWYAGVWRSDEYVVYSGYSVPGFRWTGPQSIEIDLQTSKSEPASVSRFTPTTRSGVTVSLVFNAESVANKFPFEMVVPKEPSRPIGPTPVIGGNQVTRQP